MRVEHRTRVPVSRRRWQVVWVALIGAIVSSLASPPASAHALRVFAQLEGGRIIGVASFSDQSPASGVFIDVFGDASGDVPAGVALGEAVAGADGRFAVAVPPREGYRVVAEGDEGHRVEIVVAGRAVAAAVASPGMPTIATASGASGASGAGSTGEDPLAEAKPHPAAPGVALPSGDAAPVAGMPGVSAAELEHFNTALRTLREDIHRLEQRVRVQDVVGGIGYILGVFGLAAWFMSRRRHGSGTAVDEGAR